MSPSSTRLQLSPAFTFTDKAAAELKERIVTRTCKALGGIPGVTEMFVGTTRAFCLEPLKSESPEHLNIGEVAKANAGLTDAEHRRRRVQCRHRRCFERRALRKFEDRSCSLSGRLLTAFAS